MEPPRETLRCGRAVICIAACGKDFLWQAAEPPFFKLPEHPLAVTTGPVVPLAGGTDAYCRHVFIEHVFRDMFPGLFLHCSYQGRITDKTPAEPS